MTGQKVMTAGDAARYLSISKDTLRRLVRKGEIPCWQDPETKRRRYPVAALDKWLASFADRTAS